jgi:peptide/nickel transport system ATP-binding protein
MFPLHLMEVQDVSKTFKYGFIKRKPKPVLEDISLSIRRGRTVGITGKSGIGKTSLGKIIAGITPPSKGKVLYKSRDIFEMPKREWDIFRTKVQMMFQDPEEALNPMKTINRQFHAVCRLTGAKHKDQARKQIQEVLEQTGLSDEILGRFPQQLSGGQNQRVALGRILLLKPEVIILDEPTSPLDISVQAQILHLLKQIQKEKQISYVYISHNKKLIEFMSDSIFSMDKEDENSF